MFGIFKSQSVLPFINKKIRSKNPMQQSTQILRNQLWDRLKVVFDRYADESGSIKTSIVEDIARDVLGETSPQ
jgi:phenylalanyl-tRNA synthetase beta subunit